MSAKRYFWLRLHKDFFKSKEMKKLRRIAGGDTYTIIYLKLQLLSLADNGKLFFDGVDDSFADELALEIDEAVENVQATFVFLQKVGLLEMVDEDELHLPQVVENIGSETPSASRKRKQRSNNNQQLTEKSVTMSQSGHKKVTLEKELELEIDLDKDIKKDKKREFDFSKYSKELGATLNEFVNNIKSQGKKASKTDYAWTLFFSKVDKFINIYGEEQTLTMIEDAIEGNWKTVYEPKGSKTSLAKKKAVNKANTQYTTNRKMNVL